jgi:hypothetical protein
MGTDLGDAEKVSDLLEQWAMNRHAILLMIVGSTWDDATVTALMFEGLIKGLVRARYSIILITGPDR